MKLRPISIFSKTTKFTNAVDDFIIHNKFIKSVVQPDNLRNPRYPWTI